MNRQRSIQMTNKEIGGHASREVDQYHPPHNTLRHTLNKTHTHTNIDTSTQHTHVCMHTHTHTHTLTHTHTHTHTQAHTCIHTHMHTHTHAHTHTHTHIHTCIHTLTHTHIHKHTHTQTHLSLARRPQHPTSERNNTSGGVKGQIHSRQFPVLWHTNWGCGFLYKGPLCLSYLTGEVANETPLIGEDTHVCTEEVI